MKLSVLKRNRPIQEIDLGKDVLTHDYSETVFLIGRSKDCHIVLDHKKVSREHARIIHKNGKWFVEKTSPENAATINGEEFERHELETDDVIAIEDFNVIVASENANSTDATEEIYVESKIAEKKQSPPAKKVEVVETKKAVIVEDIEESAEVVDFDLAEPDTIDSSVDFDQEATGRASSKESPAAISSDVEFADQPMDDLNIDFADSGSEAEKDSTGAIEAPTDMEFSDTPNSLIETENSNYSLDNLDGGSDEESTKVMQSFASVYLELFGDTAPYDRYIIEKDKTYIGRDSTKCQIVLNDSEVSTVHAVITRTNLMLILEDLNSSNGTIHKGARVNKVSLSHNDEFVVGGVSFTVKIRSEFLKDESATLMPVDDNQTIEVEEI
ncbi:MAG: FHA domain-containing protein, partial [Bdellovibrionales bacterium]|nr:FHA domain-containing protein [Bdellovibrionales bacterium]